MIKSSVTSKNSVESLISLPWTRPVFFGKSNSFRFRPWHDVS